VPLCRLLQVTQDDVKTVLGPCLNHRLRKDALDEVDTAGFKVSLAWRKVIEPQAMDNAG
jgi:magnesium chelatase subunit I